MQPNDTTLAVPDQGMLESLMGLGLLPEPESATYEALTGGVSSDIWRVCTEGREYCVKRALSKLKVEAAWFAPVERNQYEVAWYECANEIVPGAAPTILAQDSQAMLFAMEFLDPQTHRLWKTELHAGRADSRQAAMAGTILGRIHRETATDPAVRARFPETGIFHAIRLEPYLEATAERHPDLKQILFSLSRRTAETSLTMIHGDVSPKNILLGPRGPVFLDAECACMGDPAFDLAFCLNHFLLKCLWTPGSKESFLECFREMTESYLKEVNWESAEVMEARAASLLPGLFLARVDGKSPAEYITADSDKERVRRCARALLFDPPTRLQSVAAAWNQELLK
ncbi:phosphotransferase family protein [Aestuariirhabdus sp. LZHN29]|uniref:phosphotransferase family protein n=1 Tax=Aestuariirhabdus sp. LZHN29 TaxID=3417462 RepID=UPI003CE7D3CB